MVGQSLLAKILCIKADLTLLSASWGGRFGAAWFKLFRYLMICGFVDCSLSQSLAYPIRWY